MGKKTGVFTEGQHVFAKVKGYSPWPAKITKVIAKHRYAVYFYGTGETASVKSEDLDPYDEKNRGRYNTERQLKKNEYKEAVDQIQAALNGNDPAPISMEDNTLRSNTDHETTADITDNDNSADESQLQIAEDISKSTQQKRKITVVKVKQEAQQLVSEPEAKENDEKVSRSGRKIKEKKMNMDEMNPDDMFTQPRKRFKVEEGKQKSPTTLLDSTNAIDEFRASKMHILLDPAKKKLLENQYDMIHIMQEIKLALGLDQADIDHSIELLKKFKTDVLPHITELMLLKYPTIVETVKRLRKYIGNLDSWGSTMEETQIKEFHAKADKIRATALDVYETFKGFFNFNDDTSFWNKFAEQQKSFHEKYNALSPSDLFEGLSFEELDSLLNNQQTYGVEHPPNPLSAPKHVSLEESAVIETEKPNEELL